MAEETIAKKVLLTGRRKEAKARVKLVAGTGKIIINDRPFEHYFPHEALRLFVLQPLKATDKVSAYDISANIKGGGSSGQAGALRHGIARALVNEDQNLRPALLKQGFLTRDPRMKERKKYGQKGARQKFQWTKR